jgi:hypothetical protein
MMRKRAEQIKGGAIRLDFRRTQSSPSAARTRRVLSRTISRARWSEYRALLERAGEQGYEIASLEDAVLLGKFEADRPVLILRHDVDQHPRSALTMAAIDEEVGARSTWYFRWRTASLPVIAHLREAGFEVGLHYETLSRRGLETGVRTNDDLSGLVEESRTLLKREIAGFQELYGSIRSIAPHGDSSAPWLPNRILLSDEDPTAYGVEFDATHTMRGRPLGFWLTDRTLAEGSWADGADPQRLFRLQVSPILCLTHPNNWVSGPSLWLDRVWRAFLPSPQPGSRWERRGPLRTGPDTPPGLTGAVGRGRLR